MFFRSKFVVEFISAIFGPFHQKKIDLIQSKRAVQTTIRQNTPVLHVNRSPDPGFFILTVASRYLFILQLFARIPSQ